jgi:hypothetical protein
MVMVIASSMVMVTVMVMVMRMTVMVVVCESWQPFLQNLMVMVIVMVTCDNPVHIRSFHSASECSSGVTVLLQ